jgi:5'-methylthioadenosine phosphorylase
MDIKSVIIAGTGVGEAFAAQPGKTLHFPTPFGLLRGRVTTIGGEETLIVRRHAAGHKLPPHRVNFRAIAQGCKMLGVQKVFASAAVGSLREDWEVGTIAIASDFINGSHRNLTLFDNKVEHRDVSTGIPLAPQLLRAAESLEIPVETNAVYVETNGPRYETAAEIQTFLKYGDVIGMTAATEAALFAEANVPYGLICIISNLATGLANKPHSHEEVTKIVKERSALVIEILARAIEQQ